MKQHLAELLTLTVSKCYGDFYASIFGQLAHAGRLSLSALLRTAGRSPTHTRSALTVLLKQQLILHLIDDNGTTFYEPHWDYAYNFTIRSASLLVFVGDRHGKQVADVFGTILRNGVIRVGDVVGEIEAEIVGVEMAIAKAKSVSEEDSETAQKDFTTDTCDVKHDSPHSQQGYAHSDGDTAVKGVVNGAASALVLDGRKTELAKLLTNVRSTLLFLLQSGLVEQIRSRELMPAYDLEREAEEQVLQDQYPSGVSGKQAKYDYALSVDRLRRHWRDEPRSHFTEYQATGNKRPREADDRDYTPQAKRSKLNGSNSNDQFSSGASSNLLDDNILLRVNFEKCHVGLRTQQLVRLAARYVGETTSKVYEALLRIIEDKQLRCYDPFDPFGYGIPPPLPPKAKGKHKLEDDKWLVDHGFLDPDEYTPLVKLSEISQNLGFDLDLDAGLAGEGWINDVDGGSEVSDLYELEGNEEANSAKKRRGTTDKRRLKKIEEHLRLLAVDRRGFVSLVGMDCKVMLNTLTKTLTAITIEDSIASRFGMVPARFLRILNETGNLDDGQLTERGMLNARDTRKALNLLDHAGFLKTQDLPRDNSRQANRATWLVKYDMTKARHQLLSDIYKAMARLIQRIDVEKEKVQVTVQKSERTDVIGHEDKYLSTDEKEKLRRWHEIEDILLRQVHRMDELVAVLRDFSTLAIQPYRKRTHSDS